MIDHYAVLGQPIKHSLSPHIHTRFALALNQAMDYVAIETPVEHFEQTLTNFARDGGRGVNVTLPHKERAFAFAVSRTERAERAGAANTLWVDEQGQWCADNTDGIGLIRDMIDNLGWTLAQQSILLLGAGGAARGVLQPLLQSGCHSICIANRTVEKAEHLVKLFDADLLSHQRLTASSYEQIPLHNYQIIINATSASLQGSNLPLPNYVVSANSCCYDMMYSAQPTLFCAWAKEQGALAVEDGLGMLVEQAAEAFFIWRQQRPATTEVIHSLRKQLSS